MAEPSDQPTTTPPSSPPDAVTDAATTRRESSACAEDTPIRLSSSPRADLAPNPVDASRYEIRDEIGRGGMGAILQGHDRILGRDLAIKVLLEKHQDRPDIVQRFVEEARIGGQLQHPGIVPVYELGQLGDHLPFFTMKWVRGQTLASLLAERADPGQNLPRFLKVFEQVCQTVAYAHSKRIIHRDLKPLNIMVGSFGEVQVMDWGLAKILVPSEEPLPPAPEPLPPAPSPERRGGARQPDSPSPFRGGGGGEGFRDAGAHTQPGAIMGTPAYMSPEQARGQIDLVDERADVFGLGAVLCEILTSKPPYSGASRVETQRLAATADLRETFARLDACGADEQLLQLAKSCLAADRENRLRDASVVASSMTSYLASVQERLRVAELTRASAEARAVEERKRRHITVALASSLLALVVLAGGGGFWIKQSAETRRASTSNRVNHALAEANQLWGQARVSGDPTKWTEARAATRRARELLADGEGDDELHQQVETLQTNLDNEVREAERDRRMIARLEEIRTQRAEVRSDGFDFASAAPAYAEAFRAYDIDVEKLAPEVAGARIATRSIKLDLVAALDEWAWIRRLGKVPAAQWQRLADTARTADPDPWRNRFRDALVKGDPRALKEVAAAAPVADLPAQTLELLGHALGISGGEGDAVRLLSRAQRRYPADFWINQYLAYFLSTMEPPRLEEAIRYYTVAIALRSNNPGVYLNLGAALERKGEREEAIRAFEKALQLEPNYASASFALGLALLHNKEPKRARVYLAKATVLQPRRQRAHYHLGRALLGLRRWEEAIASFRRALQLEPNDAVAMLGMGAALMGKEALKEAIDELKKARTAHPDNAEVHAALGAALANDNNPDEALPAFREAIRLQPGFAEAHRNMGVALFKQKLFDQAIAAFEESLRLEPTNALTFAQLGLALRDKGQWELAITAFEVSLCLDHRDATVYHDLGILLSDRKDDPASACSAFEEAIRLKPDYPEAYGNLAHVLTRLGKFTEALAAARRCHELGAGKPGWRYPSGRWVRDAQRRIKVNEKLVSVLRGAIKCPPAERLELARFCAGCRRYATSARLCEEAFATQPALADDLRANTRYNAACMAAQAGRGLGMDQAELTDRDRKRWRKKALAWLRDDLALWGKELEGNPEKMRAVVRYAMPHWQRETALAPYREEADLAELPEDERLAWRKLWADVAELLKRAANP